MGKLDFLDIDAGTGRARAGLLDDSCGAPGAGAAKTGNFRPREEHSEQVPENVWRSVFDASKLAMRDAAPEPHPVSGIDLFDVA